MTRIGYIINNLPIGGAEILLLDLVRHLDNEKYKIFIYTIRKNNPLKDEFVRAGAILRELNLSNYRQFWHVVKLAKLLTADHIDIVHTHLCDADIYGRIAGKLAGKKIIISTEHSINSWKMKRDLKRRLRGKLDLLTTKFCRQILCVSQAVADFHTRWGIPYNKIKVIYPSKPFVPLKISKIAKRKELGVALQDFVVAHVGRLIEEKNQYTLLHAASNILKLHDDITFLIIGDGPLKEKLIEFVNRSGYRNKILFLGTRQDIAEILYVSDLFVLPSLCEGYGISVIEAMQQSLPVVASNIGGIPELVDENTGILVHAADIKEITEATLKFYTDRDLCQRFGSNGYTKAEKKFSFQNYVDQMMSLYDSLVKTS